jgi:ankyrin repeat protein
MSQPQNLTEALFEAAKNGDLDQVQRLVESGADVNAVGEHSITPFLWAYFSGHTEVVKYLLSRGGNVNYDGFSEGTLLTLAAFTGDVASISYLLDVGAEIDHAMPRGGETALHHAADNDQTDAIRLLIRRGADVNHQTKHDGPSELNFGTFWGETPLHVAAVRGDEAMIQALLAGGADKTIKTAEGETPLDQAERHQRPAEILQLLR